MQYARFAKPDITQNFQVAIGICFVKLNDKFKCMLSLICQGLKITVLDNLEIMSKAVFRATDPKRLA